MLFETFKSQKLHVLDELLHGKYEVPRYFKIEIENLAVPFRRAHSVGRKMAKPDFLTNQVYW